MAGRGGGQPGNTNALKHGLYAKRYTPIELKELKQMSPDDMRHEINMIRVVISRIFDGIVAPTTALTPEQGINLTYALDSAVTSLNRCARTHAILHGTYSPLTDALMDALESIPIYDDEEFPHETD